LNSSSINTQVKYALSKKIRIGAKASGMLFKNGVYKYEGSSSLEWQATKNSNCKIELNTGKISQI